MLSNRRSWLAAGAVAVVLLVGGAGAVLAQSSDEDRPPFLERVAEKLGIEPDQLEQAIRDVRNEDVDASLERGDLTGEQAEQLKERIEEGPVFPERHGFRRPNFRMDRDGPFKHERGPFGPGFGLGLPEAVDALAEFLGIEREQLLEELAADGASLASVAEAHGASRDELKAFISTEVQSRLSSAVESGVLAQERADQLQARIDGALDRLIEIEFGRPWKWFDRLRELDDSNRPEGMPEPQGGASEQTQQQS